jgi:hypothetical protein
MSTRKNNPQPPSQRKPKPAMPPPPSPGNLDAMLMIGAERVQFEGEADGNIVFMSELIDTL